MKIISLITFCLLSASAIAQQNPTDYRILATNKTSTMEKEMAAASNEGYRFQAGMGGSTAGGGDEMVVVMAKPQAASAGRYQYKLLATNKTSTMQKELQEAGDLGYQYRGQTVYKTSFGGEQILVVLERDSEEPLTTYAYKVLATSKTSTMQRELQDSAEAGFVLLGITVGDTAFGGKELVSILMREVR
jgi:hypothetical protein